METEKETPKYIFTIRVVYKSGYTHDFDVYEFSIEHGRYEWKPADEYNKPVQLGVEDIAAIWQVGVKPVTDK